MASSTDVSSFDEHQWVMQIRQTIEEELDEDTKIRVSIFNVPKTLMSSDPHCYTPQQVALGPYHCFKQEMYEMERLKLAAAKKLHHSLDEASKFENVVQKLRPHEPRIRAYYHKYLTISGETLSWMMAVDACFILEFLQIYGSMQLSEPISSRRAHIGDMTSRKSTHNAITRDIVMLENQIPLFILNEMMETKHGSLEGGSMLYSILMGFFQVISPFKTMEELDENAAMECAHLLDVLYHLVVPKSNKKPLEISKIKEHLPRKRHVPGEPTEKKEDEEEEKEGNKCWGYVESFFALVWKIIKKIFGPPLRILKKIISSKVVLFVRRLPLKIISNIPGISAMVEPIKTLLSINDEGASGDEEAAMDAGDEAPLVEQIKIPSVAELTNAYVKFQAVEAGVLCIKFDAKTRTFYLPVINLDENSEVVMRNLVAYESGNESGPVIFTRFTELMNGIINTEEDVEILRENGIIVNRLKSDEEVAKLWNGMNKCVRLTKAPFLDRVIGDVNKYYSERWKVKLRMMLKSYIFGSWQILMLLACILLLLLIMLQSFCSVYNCDRFFPIDVHVPDTPASK
ncbi:hypothetical protein Leryth_005170 [Lithospermum erythrorhizon]|nr:hypothetical protein Leryth_005170 [Lithospermum erythrorhizon]